MARRFLDRTEIPGSPGRPEWHVNSLSGLKSRGRQADRMARGILVRSKGPVEDHRQRPARQAGEDVVQQAGRPRLRRRERGSADAGCAPFAFPTLTWTRL
eukprot:gene4495-biopygen5340